MQPGSKLKKPRMRLLQPYLPREYFDTLQHTLDRHSKPTHISENSDSQTINAQQPFRKKTQDRTLAGYGAQLNVQKVAAYLEKKITANDLNSRRPKQQQLNLRYDESEEVIHKNPYGKSKIPDRRQSLLNKSHKMRSGSIANNHSPSLHRHPKSSLSNPYEIQKHKRVASISRNYMSRQEPDESSVQSLLELGRRYYKESRLDKAIDSFKRLLHQKKLVEAQYLLGVCYMNSNQFEKGVNIFTEIMEDQPDYRKNVYLLTAIAYKKLDQLGNAVTTLTRGLQVFIDDYDCLVYRAKLHMRMEKYELAAQDFLQASRQAPTKGFSYVGRADCLKHLGRFDEAILALTEALQTDLRTIAYLKRGVCHYEQGQYGLALEDFSAHIKRDSSSSQALYYKAMVYLKQGNISEALLNFDQTVKLDNNQTFVSKAVEEILKIRIDEKDFYEAYHMVARADNLDIDKQFVEDWKSFIEGTLLLMKKKHKEGVDSLTNQLNKPFFNQSLSSVSDEHRNKYVFLKPLLHLYRAFGFFSQSDLTSAKHDYHEYDCFYEQLGNEQPDPSKEYNMMLINAVEQFPAHSKLWLEKAIELYPYKTEPYLYLALAQVQDYIVCEDADIIDRVRVHLDKAVNFLPQLSNNHISNVYYHRAVINLYVNDFDKAVADVDKAIEKSEDNIPRYFYLRGLIFACCGNFGQAVQDLSVAINLDDHFAKAYLERAKCLQMEGNPNEAFLDLQKYITLKPEDPFIHKYAGFLLFQNCAYEDCLSAFSHGSELLSDVEILEAKGKCHFLLGDLNACLECLEQYQKQSSEPTLIVDTIVINLLKSLEHSPEQAQYASAEEILNKIIYSKSNEGKFFRLMDLHLLLGASLACRGHYQKAISEFQMAIKIKSRRKEETEKSMPLEDSQDEPIDFGWSILEANYCIVLCYLALGVSINVIQDLEPAESLLSTLNIKQDDEDNNWLVLFRRIVQNYESGETFAALNQLNRARAPGDRLLSRFFLPLPIKLADGRTVSMEMRFSSPQLDPPELLPEFDHELLMEFQAKNIECKPEAPWITRNSNGVVFTTNVQVFQNLELSASSATKKQEESAQMEDSVPDLSERLSEIKIDKKNLKDHFKLDQQTEQKLKRLLESKAKAKN